MSLIQLGDDRTVYLFHIFHMKAFPAELGRILRDKQVIKVGINIRYVIPFSVFIWVVNMKPQYSISNLLFHPILFFLLLFSPSRISRADGTKLFKDWGVACASMVELGSLCIQVLDDLNNLRQVRSMDSLARELVRYIFLHFFIL